MSFAPTTPSHALPGAFLHTPAIASRLNTQQQQNDPTRRRLFTEQPIAAAAAANAPPAPQPPQPPNTTAYARDPNRPFGFDAPIVDNQTMPPPSNPSNVNPITNNPQTPLAKAATYINASLTEDETYPDLDSYCRR